MTIKSDLDIVKFRISGDFNDIRLDNVQKIFPYWFENTLTVEPTNQDLKDSGYNSKEMTENEIDEAKNELQELEQKESGMLKFGREVALTTRMYESFTQRKNIFC